MTVKAGFVGCGRMASFHAGALNAIGGAEIVGVYDIDMPKAESFAEKFGAKKVCSSREELLKQCGVELLLICDYGHQHAEELHAAMDAGIRSIFCEKPVIRKWEEASALLKKQKETSSLIAVGHVRRVFKPQMKMKEIIDSGILGKIHFCRIQSWNAGFSRKWGDYFASYELSGGAALDMGTHYADLLHWFFGCPEEARGVVTGMENHLAKEEKPSDYFSGTAIYPGGIVCGMDISYQRYGVGKMFIEVYGENATLVCDGSNISVLNKDMETKYTIAAADPHQDQMKCILKMAEEKVQPPCTLKDGIIACGTILSMMDFNTNKLDFMKGI
ncbi:MAG: Gfo/Idh/MocA family oxidoreductase [Lentisphaeria bacterium]|nr:Gfo/Idh/MocA family oxidoreductase [Lentisphaeria bacterium]